MTLRPAAPNTGIRFIRTDLQNGARTIQARYDQVVDTILCTVLGNDHGARVGTVEHLMAALRALNIDNVDIEIDGDEVPIMDGSASPFVFLIEAAGIAQQNAPRRWLEVVAPVAVEHAGKKAMLLPSGITEFDVTIAFKAQAIGKQHYHLALSPAAFKTEVSRARTFGFREEVDMLRQNGLARGGSLQNAIVISEGEVLNPDGLRFPAEFARHKLLDAVGDLALAGVPIQGRFEGHCCGHQLNNELLRTLFARPDTWRMRTHS